MLREESTATTIAGMEMFDIIEFQSYVSPQTVRRQASDNRIPS